MPTLQLDDPTINVLLAARPAPGQRTAAHGRGVGARYALPVSLGAALVSVAAAGFAAGYELVTLGARHRPAR